MIYENILCENYLKHAKEESTNISFEGKASLVVVEGFEERSIAILEKFVKQKQYFEVVFIGRYDNESGLNDIYKDKILLLAKKISRGKVKIFGVNEFRNILNEVKTPNIIVDITSLSNKLLFFVLDSLNSISNKVIIGYTEAKYYFPKKDDFDKILKKCESGNLTDTIDKESWLFNHRFNLEFIANHEGYDSSSSGRVLIAFLAFKYSRLATILYEHDYSECIYIAGVPRLKENYWRLDALNKINAPLLTSHDTINVSTFNYKKSIFEISNLLFNNKNSFLLKNDLHIALTGSKLQTVGCWVISTLIPSISIISAVPTKYYPEAFSDGFGESFFFEFIKIEPLLM